MLIVNIAICLIIAMLNVLNIAFLCYLHENGRRITGVGTSVFKTAAALLVALTLRLGIIDEFQTPILIFFLAIACSAIRRTWVLGRLFQAKGGFHLNSIHH